MSRLSKRECKFFWWSTFFCFIISFFLKKYFVLNSSDAIAFVSIVMGFLLSAIAMLYSSPLRQVLYEKEIVGYKSRWEQIVVRYAYLFNYCMFFVIMLIFGIGIPEWCMVAFLVHVIILIIIVANQLFVLLLREIND